MRNGLTTIVASVLVAAAAGTAQSRLAPTPPMGWNSWNIFYGNIDETKIRQIIDAMVSTGMRDAGYKHVNLDDNWMANPARNAAGDLIADPIRFKSGIKSLSDYAHSKGMKLGIYGDRGSMTCMNIPKSGSYGNEERDAKTFASWGIDYLKYDNCNTVGEIRSDYEKMAAALAKSGREIMFSVCAWHTQEWMPQTGQLWRSTDDITAEWDPSANIYGRSVLASLDGNAGNFIFSRIGSWSDPDMLEVGNGKLTENENKAHFGLWAIMAAPLVAGNDIRNISKTTLAILTHPEVIAIDQDSAGIQGRRIRKNGDFETWAKPLGSSRGSDYDTYAVGLFNRSATTANMTIRWSDLGLDPSSVFVRDVWEKKDLGVVPEAYAVSVPSHGLALLKVKGWRDPKASIWLSDLHIHSITNGWKFLGVDKSVAGNPLKIGNKTYTKGLGTHAASRTVVALRDKYVKFQSDIGIDAETSSGSAVFQVFGDGKKLYESPVQKGGGAAVAIDVDVAGVDSLALVVTDAGDGNANDHADWGGAKLVPMTAGVLDRGGAVGNWQGAGAPGVVASLVQGRLRLESATPISEARIVDLRGNILAVWGADGAPSREIRMPGGALARGAYVVELRSESGRGAVAIAIP